ncbi:hypothetical protein AVEN_210665-1, partial [Araneus ventricosus]
RAGKRSSDVLTTSNDKLGREANVEVGRCVQHSDKSQRFNFSSTPLRCGR